MKSLIRVLGVAAIIGGALRFADSFVTQTFSAGALAVLYFTTDIFLLLGMAGIYLSRKTTLGVAGTVGVAIFVVGILLVRVSAFGLLGANGYQFAAAGALIGLAILSIEELVRGHGAGAPALLWLSALVFAIAATLGFAPSILMLLAGIAFGAGFIAAGRRVFVNRDV